MDVVRSIFACTGCQGGGEARRVFLVFWLATRQRHLSFFYGLARRHAGVSVRFPRAGLRLMSFMLSLVVCVGHRSGQRVVLSIICFSCSFHSRNLVNLINFSAFGGGLLRSCSVSAPSLVRGQPCPRCPAGCRGQGCPRTISSPTPALRPPLPAGRGRGYLQQHQLPGI